MICDDPRLSQNAVSTVGLALTQSAAVCDGPRLAKNAVAKAGPILDSERGIMGGICARAVH